MANFKIHSIKYNLAMNFLLTGLNIVFPFITLPIASRALLTETYGLCTFAITTATWFSLIAMLGVNRYGVREVARVRDNPIKLAKVTREILLVTIISTVILYICFIASLFLVERFSENRLLFFINGFTIILNTLGVQWFFQGIEQYTYITVRGISIRAACFIGVLLLVNAPSDYLIYAWLMMGATGFANIINFFYMFKLISLKSLEQTSHPNALTQVQWNISVRERLGKLNCTRHIKPLLSFLVIVSAISIYTQFDTVLLGLMSNDTQVGYYSVAIQMRHALTTVVSALTAVLLPRASNLLAKRETQEFTRIVRLSIRWVLAFSIPVCVTIAALSTPLISWYAGESFAGAGPTLFVDALVVIPIGLSVIFCDEVMIPLGLEKYCTIIYIVAAVLNVTFNVIAIPILGSLGSALATAFVETCIAVAEFIIVAPYIWGKKLANTQTAINQQKSSSQD